MEEIMSSKLIRITGLRTFAMLRSVYLLSGHVWYVTRRYVQASERPRVDYLPSLSKVYVKMHVSVTEFSDQQMLDSLRACFQRSRLELVNSRCMRSLRW